MIGLMLCDIPLKGRRRLIFAALCFNGYHLRAVLNDKVKLAIFIRKIARFFVQELRIPV